MIVRVTTAKVEPADSAQASIATNSFVATAGNLIVVLVRCGGGGGLVSSVTDTAGNTYVEAISDAGQDPSIFIYYAKNITGHASNVVTVNFSPSAEFSWAYAIQYSGLDIGSPLDAVDVKIGTGVSDLVSDPFTTTSPSVIVLAASQSAFTTYTAGADFTLVDGAIGNNLGNDFGGIEERITSGPLSSYTAHITSGATNPYTLGLASFKAALSGAGPTLFRGRNAAFFDDDEVNRFEFWPAVAAGAVSIAVPVVSIGVTAHAPVVSLGPISVSTPVASVSTEAVAPSVTRSFAMPVVEVSAVAVSPNVGVSPVTLSVLVVTVTCAAVSPPITLGANVLNVPAVAIGVSVTAPSVTNGGSFLVVPTADVSISVTNPGVVLGSLTHSTPVVENNVSAVSPTVTLGVRSLVAPVVVVQVSVIGPSVAGSLAPITVPTINVSTSAFAPDVVLGAAINAVPSTSISITITSPSVTVGGVTIAVPVSSVQITVVAPYTANVGPAYSAVLSVVAKPIAEISVELKPTALISRWT